MRLVVSLTSIPPRFGTLGTTLGSLLDQGADEVRLTLPHSYRRFACWDGQMPPIPPGIRLCRTDTDHGPATKWLSAARELAGQGVRLLACDDDWTYGPGWARSFRDAARAAPAAAPTGAAFPVRRLGLNGAPPEARIAQGFSGICFRPDALPPAAFAVPGCAFAADDLWLSGMLALSGTRIVEVPRARALCKPHAGEAAPLQAERIEGRDRAHSNRETALWLRSRFGVWRDA